MSDFQHISVTLEDILNKLQHLKMATHEREKPFMNINEASQYTGIPKQTLYQFTSRSRIPFYKLHNRRLFFDVQDLDKFILDRKNRFMSVSEIEMESINHVLLEDK